MDSGIIGCIALTIVVLAQFWVIVQLAKAVVRLPYSIVEIDEKGVNRSIRLENRVDELEKFKKDIEPRGYSAPDWANEPSIDDGVAYIDESVREVGVRG